MLPVTGFWHPGRGEQLRCRITLKDFAAQGPRRPDLPHHLMVLIASAMLASMFALTFACAILETRS